MSIRINLDVVLAKKKMSVTELSEKVGITMANISILKNGKAKAKGLLMKPIWASHQNQMLSLRY